MKRILRLSYLILIATLILGITDASAASKHKRNKKSHAKKHHNMKRKKRHKKHNKSTACPSFHKKKTNNLWSELTSDFANTQLYDLVLRNGCWRLIQSPIK